MRVYVVGYAPANEAGATGGFDWFPNPEPAIARARHDVRDLGGLGAHSVTFVPLEVPDDVAYPGGVTTPDRDGITSWIDANLHLVEVGLDDPARYEAEKAVGEVALSPEAMEAVERLLDVPGAVDRLFDAPAQTRPSAIVRRPDPETPVSDATVAELLTEAIERTRVRRGDRRGGASGREFSIVVTLLEDAITRHNKGVYMERGVFAITDAERIPVAADRESGEGPA